MQQPHKRNKPTGIAKKRLNLMKNFSDAKLDYNQTSASRHISSSDYTSNNSNRELLAQRSRKQLQDRPGVHATQADPEYLETDQPETVIRDVPKLRKQSIVQQQSKVVKKKRQKFIQPSLSNSAQATIAHPLSDQPYQINQKPDQKLGQNHVKPSSNPYSLKPQQTKSQNQLRPGDGHLQKHTTIANYGVLKIQDLHDTSQSQSFGDAKLASGFHEPCSAQKVKNMIKLVKSSAKKLQPEQLQSIRDSVSKGQVQKLMDASKSHVARPDDIPTPKASSKIVLKTNKALEAGINPTKMHRDSQDSGPLPNELRSKGVQQRVKIVKHNKLNLSHNVHSDHPELSHRDKADIAPRSPKAPIMIRETNDSLEITGDQQNIMYPTLRQAFSAKKVFTRAVTGSERDSRTPSTQGYQALEQESSKLRLQKMLSQTTKLPSGFANLQSDQLNQLNESSQRQYFPERINSASKIISPRKMEQMHKGQQHQGDLQPLMKQSVIGLMGETISALSSFTTPGLDQRLNEIGGKPSQPHGGFIFPSQVLQPREVSVQSTFTKKSLLEQERSLPGQRVQHRPANSKGMILSRGESKSQNSFGESDSLDVDEEVCTKAHFQKLQELHQPKPRISTVQPTPNSKPKGSHDVNSDNQPENVRESRKVSDARDLMLRQNDRDSDNNRIVSAGNDHFANRVELLKSEADKADRRHKQRQQTKLEYLKRSTDKAHIDASKVINTSIMPNTKSRFFNPSDKMAASQGSKQGLPSKALVKTALSEMHPGLPRSHLQSQQTPHSDHSPTPPGLSNSPQIQPAHLFGSRKHSKMVLNYFKLFLIPQYQLMANIMQYLPLDACFRLKLVSHQKSCTRDPTLRNSFEVQFFKAIINHRQDYRGPQAGSADGKSKLCLLLAQFLTQKFRLTREQERELAAAQVNNEKKRLQLNLSADTAQHSNFETGVGFEIQKDVDRTFLDSKKFTAQNRKSLATILKAFAALEPEIGYVQGLNFIVGNFIIAFDGELKHTDSVGAQRRCEKRVLSSFLGLLDVLKTRDFYTEHMLGVKEAIFKLECILYNLIPEVFIFLMQHQISLEYFVSQWLLTLFQYDIDNHEQCMMIVVLCLFFGQKVIFQIAFQMIKEIRSRLVNFSFEEALVYLKDYASEPRFSKVEFLMRVLENDLVTNALIVDLGKIYAKMRTVYSEKEMSMNFDNPTSQRVRFLRDSMPGKINIKVIWPHPGMSESPNFEQQSSSSMISISRFSLKLAGPARNEEDPYEERETMVYHTKSKNFRQMIQHIQKLPSASNVAPKQKNSQSMLVTSEDTRQQKAYKVSRQNDKRGLGSFVIPVGGRTATNNSFNDLATVSEASPKETQKSDIATEFEQWQVPKETQLRKSSLQQRATGIASKLDQTQLRTGQYEVAEEDSESDLRASRPTGNTSLFERLGIQTVAASSQYQTQSKEQKQSLFSFIQPSYQLMMQTSQRSSEKPSYRFKHNRSASSPSSGGIKIISNEIESSLSRTDSDNISQETDQLESESSFPQIRRIEPVSAMRIADLQDRLEDEELIVGNEYSTIEPPLFLSPQASNTINSRALYRKDALRQQSNLQAYERNILTARLNKEELNVRPGTKTKLEQRNPTFQPTQSNFDIDSETQTLSAQQTIIQSGVKLPQSPHLYEHFLRSQKISLTQNGVRMQASENIIESDKRHKKVNNIALTGAGFDNQKRRVQEEFSNQIFEHLPHMQLKETVKIKHPAVNRMSQQQTPEPGRQPDIFRQLDPLSTERVANLPSHQMEVLRHQETKRNQIRGASQLTDEEQPLQQAPMFMQKFIQLSKEIKPKNGRDTTKITQQANAQFSARLSGESVNSPLNLDEKLAKTQQTKQRDRHQANYNTKDNFNTVRFATQQKSTHQIQVSNQYPQPKTQVETPNMTQTMTKPLISALDITKKRHQ